MVLGFSNLYAQTIVIPETFFGTNYWYYQKTTAPPFYTDRFDDKISDLRTAKIKLVRIGGNYFNKTLVNVADFWLYDRAIDSVLNLGATPILQVPINLSDIDRTAWVDHFNTKGIQYWAIGNEPDPASGWESWHNPGTTRQDSNNYDEFVEKFKDIATVIKNASSGDIVVGPDFRLFWSDPFVNDPLDSGSYYADFIADVGTATANGVPMLDIFTFHYYGFTTDGVMATRFATVKGYIDAANTIRTGSDLSLAMGEVNASASSGAGITKPWDFAAGQFLGICVKYILKNSGEFICPWSVYESSGDHDATDFSLYNDTGTRRSTMWHLSLLSENWRGYYMASQLNKVNFYDKISVVGMTDLNGSTVMIMNTTSTAYTYSAKLNNTYSSAVVNVKIKLKTKNLNTTEWNDTIPAHTTMVYTVSATGTLLNKYIYDATMTTGPMITVLAVALANSTISSGVSTYAVAGNDQVNLYPVPVQDNLHVDGATQYKSIQIYNTVGRVVYAIANPNQSTLTIDVSGMAPGIYYMHLKGDSKTIVKKLIKN